MIGGGTPETDNVNYWNGGIQWFTPSEVGQSKYIEKSERTISIEGLSKSSAKLLPVGTLLLSTRATVGECSIALNECSTNQGFQSLIASDKVNNEFLYYLIATKKRHFVKYACGSTFLEISNKEVAKTKIFVPQQREQEKIATFLSKIDQRIETQSKIIEKLQSQIIAISNIMVKAISQKISLGEICVFERKTAHQSSEGLSNGTYPFFTNEEETVKFFNSYDFNGEYIIANTGGKANFKYYNGKFAAMSDCLIIKIKDASLTKFYSIVFSNLQKYIDYVGFEGSGLKHLNKDWLLKLQVPQYGSEAETFIKIINNLKEKLQKEKDILSLYKKQKAYLLSNMFI